MTSQVILTFSVAGYIGWDDDEISDINSFFISTDEHVPGE